jgi:hypothetical protein
MIKLAVKSLEVTENSPMIRVTLQNIEGTRELDIYVGIPEAIAIQSHLEGRPMPRPMTHDLMINILSTLQVKILQVLISDMTDKTYFAVLTLSVGGRVHEIDCRPSDAIALAVRAAAPIFISEELLTRIEQLREAEEIQAPHPGAIIVDREDTTIH